jgi:hypothetical protein
VFGDLSSRVVEPLLDLGLSPKDLAKFFAAAQVAFSNRGRCASSFSPFVFCFCVRVCS